MSYTRAGRRGRSAKTRFAKTTCSRASHTFQSYPARVSVSALAASLYLCSALPSRADVLYTNGVYGNTTAWAFGRNSSDYIINSFDIQKDAKLTGLNVTTWTTGNADITSIS